MRRRHHGFNRIKSDIYYYTAVKAFICYIQVRIKIIQTSDQRVRRLLTSLRRRYCFLFLFFLAHDENLSKQWTKEPKIKRTMIK